MSLEERFIGFFNPQATKGRKRGKKTTENDIYRSQGEEMDAH